MPKYTTVWERIRTYELGEFDEETGNELSALVMYCPYCKRYAYNIYNNGYGLRSGLFNYCPNCGERTTQEYA